MLLYDQLKSLRTRCGQYMAEFEDVYSRLQQRGEPGPFQVLFPIVYKRAIDHVEQKNAADKRLLVLVGQYLSTRHPELSSYFISREQRESLEEMRDLLVKHMEDAK